MSADLPDEFPAGLRAEIDALTPPSPTTRLIHLVEDTITHTIRPELVRYLAVAIRVLALADTDAPPRQVYETDTDAVDRIADLVEADLVFRATMATDLEALLGLLLDGSTPSVVPPLLRAANRLRFALSRLEDPQMAAVSASLCGLLVADLLELSLFTGPPAP